MRILLSLSLVLGIQQIPDDEPLLEIELHSSEGSRHLLIIYPKTENVHAATSSDAKGAFVLLPVLLADMITLFAADPV